MRQGKPLERRTPLRSKTGLRSVKPGERVTARRRPARDTGPTRAEREIVEERAHWCCELCGILLAELDADGVKVSWIRPHSDHHRQPRGMGGSSDPMINDPSRRMLVCGTDNKTGCHGLIESQRVMAKDNGWLVPRPTDPATVPVLVFPGVRVLLTSDGDYEEV